MRRHLPLLFVLFLLPACASDKGFFVSGQSIDALGQTFVVTANAMNQLLDAKTVTPEQYAVWAGFAAHFQIVYPAVVQGWKSAVQANDAARQQEIIQAVTVLAGSLYQFTTVVMTMTNKGA